MLVYVSRSKGFIICGYIGFTLRFSLFDVLELPSRFIYQKFLAKQSNFEATYRPLLSHTQSHHLHAVMASTEPSISKLKAEETWYAALPAPKTTAPSVSRNHLLSWLKKDKVPGKDFVLVDLRRMDYEVSSLVSY
jgi:hypothetical protein